MTTLFRSGNQQKLLTFFFSNPTKRVYLREIARQTHISVGGLQSILALLEKESLLKSEREGPLKYFWLNKEHPYLVELQNIVLSEARKKELEKNLKKAVRILKAKYHPDKIIAFGSFVSGHVKPFSDLDLLIVKKDIPSRYWDRVKELAPLFEDCDVGIDYLVWRPEELKEAEKNNPFFNQEIKQKGKTLYERSL